MINRFRCVQHYFTLHHLEKMMGPTAILMHSETGTSSGHLRYEK
jgi:hypothetical protein